MAEEELWTRCPGFPLYEVSTSGKIFNLETNREMSVRPNNHGHPKISLMELGGTRRTVSVAKLIAEAFCPRPTEDCNQLIRLDGDFGNLTAANLAWRPPKFAWKYTRQMKEQQPLYFRNLPVVNDQTGVEYTSIVDAGITEGLLFEDIWWSTYTGNKVFPAACTFKIIERV
jgi:hypothetical protein